MGEKMKFFNLDLHIGVIGDIKQILEDLGHEVTSWSISAHAWVLGQPMAKVDVIGPDNWREIDKDMCDAFYERYKHELEAYDAFIVTHTPSFSMLYEKWNKPIICVASTRYECPYTHDRTAWEGFNSLLQHWIDDRKLIPLANNRYDADYAEYFTQRQWDVIPSLCGYTGAQYSGTREVSILCSKFKGLPTIPGLVSKDKLASKSLLSRAARKLGLRIGKQGYAWSELAEFKSAVWIPYNASIMSIFEMYTANIPMFFPTPRFLEELFRDHGTSGVLSELSYNQVLRLPSGSSVPGPAPDPNNYSDITGMMYWVSKADFYDPDNMPHLCYFDSFDELQVLLRSADIQKMHEGMMKHNIVRKHRAYTAWSEVLTRISTE